jgi:hypothetical protein
LLSTNLIKIIQYLTRKSGTSKITIPVIEILDLIMQTKYPLVIPVLGKIRYQIVIDTGNIIGIDLNGSNIFTFRVMTDMGRNIISAFPGESIHGDSD